MSIVKRLLTWEMVTKNNIVFDCTIPHRRTDVQKVIQFIVGITHDIQKVLLDVSTSAHYPRSKASGWWGVVCRMIFIRAPFWALYWIADKLARLSGGFPNCGGGYRCADLELVEWMRKNLQ